MSTALAILLGCAAALLLVPVCVLFIEVLFALSRRAAGEPRTGERPRLAILIPAHNEASVIAATLRAVLAQLRDGERVLVVADNCSDETARIAIAEGAAVVERTDTEHRGKGYAIDHGLRQLAADAPDVVVIVDADCTVAAGAIDLLARRCAATGRPVQALYLMRAPISAGLKLRVAELAWLIKNQVRPAGLHRLHLPCHLTGSGMAFPWGCILKAKVASGHIVEDLQLGIDLARMGSAPLFCPEALVTSEFPLSPEGVRTQRQRWEHGHLATLLGEAGGLLLHAIRSRDAQAASLALDLSVPPVALLTLLVVLACCAGVALEALTGIRVPLELTLAELLMITSAIVLSWARYGRAVLSLRELTFAPIYVLSKVPLYGRFLANRQREWIRSKRD